MVCHKPGEIGTRTDALAGFPQTTRTAKSSVCEQGIKYPPMGDMPMEAGSARVKNRVRRWSASNGSKEPRLSCCN